MSYAAEAGWRDQPDCAAAYDQFSAALAAVTVAPVQPVGAPGDAPVDFAALVHRTIAKPGRYLGNELGVHPRDWDQAWPAAGVC